MPRTREQDRIYQRERRARKKADKAAEAALEADQAAPEQPTAPPEYAGRHTRAVLAMIAATGLDQLAAEAPLVELVKDLARDLDAGEKASTVSQYRSALADLRRIVTLPAAKPKASTAEETPAPAPKKAPMNDLARFKAKRGIA